EGTARTGLAGSSNPPPAKPWFEDFSGRLHHTHHEEPFDDFLRQPLLPRKLSQLGPGITWFDFDRDGHQDLIIGSGKGGLMAVFRGDGKGNFEPLTNAVLAMPVARDQTCAVGIASSSNSTAVLVGASNYEDGQASGSML